jgi:hypothetical protein
VTILANGTLILNRSSDSTNEKEAVHLSEHGYTTVEECEIVKYLCSDASSTRVHDYLRKTNTCHARGHKEAFEHPAEPAKPIPRPTNATHDSMMSNTKRLFRRQSSLLSTT